MASLRLVSDRLVFSAPLDKTVINLFTEGLNFTEAQSLALRSFSETRESFVGRVRQAWWELNAKRWHAKILLFSLLTGQDFFC